MKHSYPCLTSPLRRGVGYLLLVLLLAAPLLGWAWAFDTTGFSPSSGPAGTRVTIMGSNLDQVTGVRFGTGGLALFSYQGPTSLVVRVSVDAAATSPTATQYFVAELAVADHFSEFYLTGNSVPLPVKLITFTAALADPTTVSLAWATASEQNSLAFEVERSLDGQQFTRIGTVAAAGSSTAISCWISSYPLVRPCFATACGRWTRTARSATRPCVPWR